MGLLGNHVPAFFSWTVRSAQFSFMRSRRAIQSSACSVFGMPSHRFSMFARVGLEMAVEAAAFWTMVRRAEGAAARVARSSEVRIMLAVGRGVENGFGAEIGTIGIMSRYGCLESTTSWTGEGDVCRERGRWGVVMMVRIEAGRLLRFFGSMCQAIWLSSEWIKLQFSASKVRLAADICGRLVPGGLRHQLFCSSGTSSVLPQPPDFMLSGHSGGPLGPLGDLWHPQ
jgi:hypothetical protein